ncbi:ATP-binding cassette domain-containing protein [bacterium]|nr:ATP-binding cassette domain-containing protein [bacterium]
MSKTRSSIIELKDVDVHYSSKAWRETSLKTLALRMLNPRSIPKNQQDFHALRKVNLRIEHGDRVALLGHNGAGKSTLLKTMAGLYPISGGKRTIRGNVRALFELTLGFELEATGRENIMYRGLLLGETPKNLASMSEEIVAFADLGDFIDYPVKTYSAGMMVRLAFAISTAIKGDILLLDEVIGAGDVKFKEKAKRRMQELIHTAEIMVLASHDMEAVSMLCNRGVVVHKGQVIFDGTVEAAVERYREVMAVPPEQKAGKPSPDKKRASKSKRGRG